MFLNELGSNWGQKCRFRAHCDFGIKKLKPCNRLDYKVFYLVAEAGRRPCDLRVFSQTLSRLLALLRCPKKNFLGASFFFDRCANTPLPSSSIGRGRARCPPSHARRSHNPTKNTNPNLYNETKKNLTHQR